MESFASRERWLLMKVEAALGRRRPASKLDFFCFFFGTGSCVLDIGSVLGIQPPSRRQQAIRHSVKVLRQLSLQNSPTCFPPVIVTRMTAGAATFDTDKATNKQTKQNKSCSYIVSPITFLYSKKRRKKRQLIVVEQCST